MRSRATKPCLEVPVDLGSNARKANNSILGTQSQNAMCGEHRTCPPKTILNHPGVESPYGIGRYGVLVQSTPTRSGSKRAVQFGAAPKITTSESQTPTQRLPHHVATAIYSQDHDASRGAQAQIASALISPPCPDISPISSLPPPRATTRCDGSSSPTKRMATLKTTRTFPVCFARTTQRRGGLSRLGYLPIPKLHKLLQRSSSLRRGDSKHRKLWAGEEVD